MPYMSGTAAKADAENSRAAMAKNNFLISKWSVDYPDVICLALEDDPEAV